MRHPDGRTRSLDLPGGVALGVGPRVPCPPTGFRIEPGAVLARCADRPVERPGTDDGIASPRLAPARAGAPAAGPGSRSPAGVGDRGVATARHATDRPDGIALPLAARRARPARPTRPRWDTRGPGPAGRSGTGGAPRLLGPGSVDMVTWSD
ncbi:MULTISPECIES: hypothetical protein [Streptomyces]|uniref:Uncharacterized protein n=1 Tax=Streptomyces lienomycini TaxID=284035 RepID=A0ABV9WP34_9ACTN